ncbi:hypothetical protein FF36_02214 [Frankia torreyi]|uniref:Uncharacterized protein n=1 Tax=Frankia torreyi TaxID=1856 RepID=A0A0D8BGV6_9ACTN|nr:MULTISPECIES: hypothetical protein [Frankia]KJE23508.1 hypothetical protein FF36_02214 [Frankia torreyi]KQC40021.1 hypothetical protein UK82_01525 [Frankia sp. ACN1ag]KQM05490.1 hypothetical protein FF86_101536 [Frankia sp. CpI1-P]
MSTGSGLNAADLAREQAELLPDRLTLAAVEINRNEFDPSNYPVNSPGSNNSYIENHSEPQIAYSSGSVVESIVNSWSQVNQW